MTRLSLIALSMALTGPALAQPVEQGPKNVPEFEPAWPTQTRAPAQDSGVTLDVQTVADGLSHPWGIEVLPDGGYLVTERPGRLRVIEPDGTLRDAPVDGVPEVMSQGQGGLLDVKLAEDFAESGLIFLSYAKPMDGGESATAMARGILNDDRTALTDVRDIFVQEPAYANDKHFGSRIVTHDGNLFITTGERSDLATRERAQDYDKTYGKVVRVTPTGSALPDNPFVTVEDAIDTIWTLGHRNVQGADMRPGTDELWTLEHGPKGGDELNLIQKGANYGWPVVSYGQRYSGEPIGSGEPRLPQFREPQYYWDPVIAPGGFQFYEGDLFEGWNGDVIASSLRPGGIRRLVLDGDRIVGEEKFLEDRGRIRDVEIDSDDSILLLTDYDDGAVLRVTPQR
ncbi:glucose sorbosone dehydrogenase [Oceaniovalibus guishaninsula JLT2003]|uniref:Glucose sorbosone dehydrogenase n=1 Tax=Oceaniovalibus guishaninsula JLT2003 TaxID=1231392 RepID=K2I8V1_9RHOB|nr:PQQ-dependent sugar dehydrogenase [Oceaniovalibus guishaninsula]EKE45445.1 glucose sorbosone dehydrogenase [Oceaniovalibus guishaninsula JLT2003]